MTSIHEVIKLLKEREQTAHDKWQTTAHPRGYLHSRYKEAKDARIAVENLVKRDDYHG